MELKLCTTDGATYMTDGNSAVIILFAHRTDLRSLITVTLVKADILRYCGAFKGVIDEIG